MDSIVNKNQRKPVIDIQGDTNSVETTDQDSPQILMDSKIFKKNKHVFIEIERSSCQTKSLSRISNRESGSPCNFTLLCSYANDVFGILNAFILCILGLACYI